MTLHERVIVSAYTGYLMCDFSHVHKYIEEKMGRPVWTHEMRASNKSFHEELTKRVKPDFLKLCGNETTPQPATEQETHEAVVKLARGELEEHERINCWFRPEFVRALIDRLDAAHKREVEATAAKCCQLGRLAGYGASEIKHQQESVGNAAKLREAAVEISEIVQRIIFLYGDFPVELHDILRKANAVLAAPARNCDMFGGDIEKLREACLRERGLNPDEDFPEIFCEWLLAATKKGGAK